MQVRESSGLVDEFTSVKLSSWRTNTINHIKSHLHGAQLTLTDSQDSATVMVKPLCVGFLLTLQVLSAFPLHSCRINDVCSTVLFANYGINSHVNCLQLPLACKLKLAASWCLEIIKANSYNFKGSYCSLTGLWQLVWDYWTIFKMVMNFNHTNTIWTDLMLSRAGSKILKGLFDFLIKWEFPHLCRCERYLVSPGFSCCRHSNELSDNSLGTQWSVGGPAEHPEG